MFRDLPCLCAVWFVRLGEAQSVTDCYLASYISYVTFCTLVFFFVCANSELCERWITQTRVSWCAFILFQSLIYLQCKFCDTIPLCHPICQFKKYNYFFALISAFGTVVVKTKIPPKMRDSYVSYLCACCVSDGLTFV